MSEEIYAIGVDLGGTKIEVALVNSLGVIQKKIRVPTAKKEGVSAVEAQIIALIQELQKEIKGHLVGVGVGVAGQVELNTGVVTFAPNLDWHHVPLQEHLREKLNLPVVILNDVRAATWGEWLYGAGQGYQDVVCVFIGTGIGGGVICSGQVLNGCSNALGEIGHMSIDLNGPLCTCGNRGCFEALAGGWAIARQAKEMIQSNSQEGIHLIKLSEELIENVTAKKVVQAFHEGDPLVQKLMANVQHAIIVGTVNLVNAFNPCRLILGGGIMEGLQDWIPEIEKGIQQRALKAATRNLQVIAAQLHGDAGSVGAAAVALRSQR